jgi:Protein of unknown function (DUF2635)
MFVKPALFREADGPGQTHLIVRHPGTRRALAAEGEEVPDTAYWHRRLQCGDVEIVERQKVGELVADGQTHETVIAGDHPALPAEHEGA